MTCVRVHPRLVVGQRIGDVTVVAQLPTPYRGRSDERVRWRCVCGTVGEGFAFNLRRRTEARCRHQRPFSQHRADACLCGHGRDDHRRNGGECLDDDCSCIGFESEPVRGRRAS